MIAEKKGIKRESENIFIKLKKKDTNMKKIIFL